VKNYLGLVSRILGWNFEVSLPVVRCSTIPGGKSAHFQEDDDGGTGSSYFRSVAAICFAKASAIVVWESLLRETGPWLW
jgi:hypothetical protein